jgi:hypothetical protein
MVVKLLEELGVFFGARKDPNRESIFFQRLNQWMFKQANATWDNPYNFTFINARLKKQILQVLEHHLKGPRRIEFLGGTRYFRYKDIRDLEMPWGWKDPRNTFTIDIWKELFSDARLLHIYRNPIDVAVSLRNRELRIQKEFKKGIKVKIVEFLLMGRAGYQDSLRVEHINEGIQLWETYVSRVFSLSEEFKDRLLHVKYEDLIEKPQEVLMNILGFVNLKVNKKDILSVKNMIKPERRYAFVKNEELLRIYNQIRENDLIKKLNYSNIQ